MTLDQSDVQDWLTLMRAEYLEMPGLALTRPQVQCLWGLDSDASGTLLGVLVSTGFLRENPQHSYVLTDGYRSPSLPCFPIDSQEVGDARARGDESAGAHGAVKRAAG
jgi:hypothetical protein